jgi:hypothetical protein
MWAHDLTEEVEIKLAAVGPRPRSTFAKLRRLRELGPFRLAPIEKRLIEDRYYDVERRELSARGLALRLRRIAGRDLVTLKFPGRWIEDGLTKRGEMELPWSEASWNTVRDRIAARGVLLGRVPPKLFEDASAAFESLGLTIIQRRDTLRESFSIQDSTQMTDDEPRNVLCLDETAHYRDGLTARRFEVEVETQPVSEELAREFARLLRDMFPEELIPWPYGKLATGMALDALLALGCAGTLVSGEEVTVEGYRRLRERLELGDADHGTGQCLNTHSATSTE